MMRILVTQGLDAWACKVPGHYSVMDLLRSLKPHKTAHSPLLMVQKTIQRPESASTVAIILPGWTRLCDVVRDKGTGAILRIEPVAAYDVIRDLVVDYSRLTTTEQMASLGS